MNAHQRRKSNRHQIREGIPKPLHVQNWAELARIPDSETHRLDIDVESCNGWIYEKANKDAFPRYLSTHTFYGLNYKHSMRLLRECGFNVSLANWG